MLKIIVIQSVLTGQEASICPVDVGHDNYDDEALCIYYFHYFILSLNASSQDKSCLDLVFEIDVWFSTEAWVSLNM